jgi:hypothetical protein
MDFTEFRSRLARVIDNLDQMALDSAMDVKETIADLNVEQLESGITNKGKPIRPKYRSKLYAQYKKAIGAKPALYTPDLKVTGEFHSSIYAKRYPQLIETNSDDKKAGKLIEKYPDILGLTSKSQKDLNKEILPNLNKRIQDELFAS